MADGTSTVSSTGSEHTQSRLDFGDVDGQTTGTNVETVVLLRGVNVDSHISVDLDVSKLN